MRRILSRETRSASPLAKTAYCTRFTRIRTPPQRVAFERLTSSAPIRSVRGRRLHLFARHSGRRHLCLPTALDHPSAWAVRSTQFREHWFDNSPRSVRAVGPWCHRCRSALASQRRTCQLASTGSSCSWRTRGVLLLSAPHSLRVPARFSDPQPSAFSRCRPLRPRTVPSSPPALTRAGPGVSVFAGCWERWR